MGRSRVVLSSPSRPGGSGPRMSCKTVPLADAGVRERAVPGAQEHPRARGQRGRAPTLPLVSRWEEGLCARWSLRTRAAQEAGVGGVTASDLEVGKKEPQPEGEGCCERQWEGKRRGRHGLGGLR